MKMRLYIYNCVAATLFLLFCSGCGMVRRAAVKQVGDSLSSEKTMEVISSDNDPDLVWDAMPFALKTMEVMLAQDTSNENLKFALASGYVQYAQGHLAMEARMVEDVDYYRSQHLLYRTYNLSIRGRDYALSALDTRYPDFSKKIRIDPNGTLAQTEKEDVPLLYWAAAGWASAISANKMDMETMNELPVTAAMMTRALELDENFNNGAIHEFFIAYEAGRPGGSESNMKNAEMHFKKALDCSGGKRAYPYVLYAESVAVKKQDLLMFNELLDKALAINPNDVKQWRLVNTIAQDRARWLKTRIPMLFVDYKENEK